MRKSLLVRQIFPFLFWYAVLIATAIGADFLLHRIGVYWIGRYLGIPGSALIVGSFAYSLRKRGILRHGSPKRLLDIHEAMSWAGALMILVHAGAHFNALLPWAALVLMLIAVASGFTGKYLLKDALERLRPRQAGLGEGRQDEKREATIFLDSLTVGVMKRWRSVHLPITVVFAVLALLHILSIVIFWRW